MASTPVPARTSWGGVESWLGTWSWVLNLQSAGAGDGLADVATLWQDSVREKGRNAGALTPSLLSSASFLIRLLELRGLLCVREGEEEN